MGLLMLHYTHVQAAARCIAGAAVNKPELGRFLHAGDSAGLDFETRKERAMATLMQDTAPDQRTMSSRVEAVGRELARYGLVVVVG